jgi:hypothetical protein
VKDDEMDRNCSTNGEEEEFKHVIATEARRKQATRKIRRIWTNNTYENVSLGHRKDGMVRIGFIWLCEGANEGLL